MVMVERRWFVKAGKRGSKAARTYHDGHRSFRGAQSGWRGVGFGMSTGHEAYDAELTAIAYGLHLLKRTEERGRNFRAFTDFTATMARLINDAPGPGQEMAIVIIDLVQELVDQGNTVTIRWNPAHRAVEWNEQAGQVAQEAATLPLPRRMT